MNGVGYRQRAGVASGVRRAARRSGSCSSGGLEQLARALRADRLRGNDLELLVDQGTADKLLERELKPELLAEACAASGQPLTLRRHEGYDHGYYFIATFMGDHLRHHARALGA